MRYFATFFLILAFPLLADSNASYPPNTDETQGGMRSPTYSAAAAEAIYWLNLVDQEQYGPTWTEAGSLFKDVIDKGFWTAAMKGVRKPLGYVKTRNAHDHQALRSLPSGTKGTFMEIIYRTTFSKKSNMKERIVMMLDEKGNWRVVSYSIT